MCWIVASADDQAAVRPLSGTDIVLRGTIVDSQDPQHSIAMLSFGNGESLLVGVGSSLQSAGRLVRIESKRIVLDSGGVLYEVTFNTANSVAIPVSRDDRPTPNPSPEATAAVADAQPYLDRSQLNQGIDKTEYPMIP
jgi:hypothetical protein